MGVQMLHTRLQAPLERLADSMALAIRDHLYHHEDFVLEFDDLLNSRTKRLQSLKMRDENASKLQTQRGCVRIQTTIRWIALTS